MKHADSSANPTRVVVTGDAIRDVHIYEGERPNPRSEVSRGTLQKATDGGAALLHDVLQAVRQRIEEWNESDDDNPAAAAFDLQFGLEPAALNKLPDSLHSYGLWKPFPREPDGDTLVWRLAQPLGYGTAESKPFVPQAAASVLGGEADILVLDDGDLGFRSVAEDKEQDHWPAALSDENATLPSWIVLKTSSPIAAGNFWQQLVSQPSAGHRQGTLADRTILLVSIADIREEQVRISRGISWERTALDLVHELKHNSVLVPLLRCRHCIFSFGSEGALHADRQHDGHPTFRLLFDPAHQEGDWGRSTDGEAFGYMSCLTAAIVTWLNDGAAFKDEAKVAGCIEGGIQAGLSAMRALRVHGHGPVEAEKPAIPYSEIAREILDPQTAYSTHSVPAPDGGNHIDVENWTFLAGGYRTSQEPPLPLTGIGRRVALRGPDELGNIPYQRFGGLFTVDRSEIESLRNLRRLILQYESLDKGDKPLSIAVFGAPGSGKSFSVKQIARAVLGGKVPILEFNLSQFKGPDDLIGALHQVRDKVLEGRTPVVFWDEFDCNQYDWLRLLLAPMQDGAFREGQIVHPIGKCLFIFAGGTSFDFDNFGPDPDSDDFKDFKLKKGPDFISRLNGYINVLGPNRRQIRNRIDKEWVEDPIDIYYPIRRALFIRAILGLKRDEKLDVDSGVLSALIEIERYNHGARSLQKILDLLKASGRPNDIRRSDVPPADLVSIHVDYTGFIEIVNRNLPFQLLADKLAPAVHQFYLDLAKKEGWTPTYSQPFDGLPLEVKEDNRAAAIRIPQVLEQIGLFVVPAGTQPDQSAQAGEIIETHIEQAAAAEHDGWMDHKLRNGWKYGPQRRDEERIHHLLIPYSDLDEENREKDRNSVRKFPEIVPPADYAISPAPR